MDSGQVSAWISVPRLAPFVEAVGGDRERALALYEWHGELAAACFGAMHHFEVLVRNAIDSELGRGDPESPLTATWLLDFDTLRPDGVKQVIVAAERLGKGQAITRSRIVAGLPFGFWSGLFGGRYEDLWRHRLRHAFAHAGERKELSVPMEALRRFRNRLAHHDSILQEAVEERQRDMLRIAGFIDPVAESWLESTSGIAGLLAQRPGGG
jgi:hypothetical protein